MMSFSKNAHLLLILFWLFIVVSFCASHLTNDFFVFIAWGRSVAQNESFDLTSFTQLWEIKGYFSRVLYFLLYSVSTIFVEDVGLKFQIIYKIVGCVAINAIIGLSIWSLPKDYATAKKNCFWFFSAALLSLHFSCHLQPEFWAVAFLSLSLALYLRKSI